MKGVMSRVDATLFGNSMNSELRALFYHELARASGASLVLHPKKEAILMELQRAMASDRMAILRELGQEVVSNVLDEVVDLGIPPLSFWLVCRSYEEDRPLIELAIELRDHREIRSLRKLLAQLEGKARSSRTSKLLALKARGERIAERIKSRAAYDLPVLCQKSLFLSELPAVSTVLKLAGMGELGVPDIVLYERGYVTFFERWVNNSPESS